MKSVGLLQSVFCRHWLDPMAVDLWRDSAIVAVWIEVEQALAQVQADVGLIPESAAIDIRKIDPTQIDWVKLESEIAHHMHPFTPVLRQLERLCPAESAGYLHWGATTQNIFDTTSALQLKRTLDLVDAHLVLGLDILGKMARKHAATLQAGRTHGQHALPITFGLKLASWHAEMERHLLRLRQSATCDLVAVMGGAVGSFAAMEGKGREVQARLAKQLDLADAGIPMRSMVDRFAHVSALLALMGSTIEKIAREVIFLQRTEIAEVSESHHIGKMGSSTMAHKRNPSHAMNLVGLSYRLRSASQLVHEAMICENEGFASQANLTDVSLAEVAVCGASLAAGWVRLLDGLQVNDDAMRRNLAMTDGLIMSEALMMRLGRKLGRHVAHDVLYEVTRAVVDEGMSLAEALGNHPALMGAALQVHVGELIEPASYVGESRDLVFSQVGDPASS